MINICKVNIKHQASLRILLGEFQLSVCLWKRPFSIGHLCECRIFSTTAVCENKQHGIHVATKALVLDDPHNYLVFENIIWNSTNIFAHKIWID